MKIRAHYFGIGPVLVAMILAFALLDISWPMLRGHERYPDPVAGAVTWNAIDKGRDMHALMLLIGSAAALTLLITIACHETAPLGVESSSGNAVNQLLLFSVVPAGWRLAISCMNQPDLFPPLRFVSVFPLGAVVVVVMLRRYRDHLSRENVFTVGAAALLIPVMAGFSALAIGLTASRLIPGAPAKLSHYVAGFSGGAVGAAIAATITAFIISKDISILTPRLLRLLMIFQFPVPLLFIYLLPPQLVDLSKQFRNPYPTGLAITLVGISLVSMWMMYRRFRSTGVDPDRPLIRAIAPVAVAAMCVFVFCGTSGLPTVSRDYFHTGEGLLPWQQLWNFHQIPYVDFAPIHGLMELGQGAVNQLFFDGSVGTYEESEILLAGFATAVTAITAAWLLSPLTAMFLLLSVMPDMSRMYFVAPPLFVVALPRLLNRPTRWLAIWCGMVPLLCAYNPAMGPAFALGTAPVFAWQVIRSVRREPRRFFGLVGILGVTAGLLLIIPMVRQISVEFVKFILNNQWTNEAANGIAWSQGGGKRDRAIGIGSTQFLWETWRFAWIPAIIASSVLYWKQWNKPREERSVPFMVLSVSIPPMLLCSCLWVIERIDRGTFGRSGTLTEVALFLLAPALVFLSLPKKNPGLVVLVMATIIGLISPNGLPTGIDPDLLLQKTASTRVIPASAQMIDGAAIGFPLLGQVIKPDPDFTADIFQLRRTLGTLLKPGETYLDLIGCTEALYYYLDLPCPVGYAGYVAANARLQATMMQQLQRHPVPAVLIAPIGWLDDVPMSIRCYRPYHDYVLKFSAISRDGYTFLVDPARVPSAGQIGSEPQLQILDSVFALPNLHRLPIAWGQSWNTMQNRFDEVASLPDQVIRPSPGQPAQLDWAIPPRASSGAAADFLRLHFTFSPTNPGSYGVACQGDPAPTWASAEPQLALSWTNDDKRSLPILFKGQIGDVVVPLGAYPRWLLGRNLRQLTLVLQNPGCTSEFHVSNIELLYLKPL